MKKILLLLLILSIKNASADNMYTDVHARSNASNDFAECSAYTALMADMKGIKDTDRETLGLLAIEFRDHAIDWSSIEVTNYNIDYNLNKLYAFAIEKGLKEFIMTEQPLCSSLAKDYAVRYNYWISNPKKSFLDKEK